MAKESKTDKKVRTQKIIALLKKYYPDAHCALNHESAEQLIIATVLSAQCTDERVNLVTPILFQRYPDMKSLAEADLSDLEHIIRSTGFFRMKAKNLKKMAQILVQQHGGRVPADMAVLTELPGVGRKTANVVLGNSFGLATGVVVDTHVQRLSRRLGLSAQKQPVPIEQELMDLVPAADWVLFSHLLISHGRGLCKARNPKCEQCFLLRLCPQKIG